MNDPHDLLPCPFCGGEAEIIECDEPSNKGGKAAQCPRCKASSRVHFSLKESALRFVTDAWNARVTNWQPIETAPVGTRLMFWWRPVNDDNPYAEAIVIGSLPYPPTGQWWNDQTGSYQDIWHVTHWKGLPKPPEGRGPPPRTVEADALCKNWSQEEIDNHLRHAGALDAKEQD